MQNGLGNIEKINQSVDIKQIIAGTSTNGASMIAPRKINHAGKGGTVMGVIWDKLIINAGIICEPEEKNLCLVEKGAIRLGEHKYLGWPSITPTTIQTPVKGVAQINVVPRDAYMTLDVRTVPGQDHDSIISQVQGILDRLMIQYSEGDDKFDASLEVIDNRPVVECDKDEDIVKALELRCSLELQAVRTAATRATEEEDILKLNFIAKKK